MNYNAVIAALSQAPTRDQIRQQVRDAMQGVRDAARDVARVQSEAPVVAQGIPADPKVIAALQQSVAAEKASVQALTSQLVQGLSEAREDAIKEQLETAQERVQIVQGQLDHALGISEPSIAFTSPPDFPFQSPQIPELVLPIVSVVMGTLAFMVVGWPIARAWARRMDRRYAAPPPSPDMSPRFDRVEQAIEAMAIEVERISEGQRFSTRLLSEMRALPAPNPLNEWKGAQQRAGDVAEQREGKG